MTKELYWTSGALLISIIATGLIFSFKFLDAVEVQLHDTYLIILPVHFGLTLWILLTFIIFLAIGFKTRFARIAGTWILLLMNSILLVLGLILTYWAYVFFISDMVVEIFRETKRIESISFQFYYVMTICLLITVSFLIGEFLLIKRLIKLRVVK